MRVALLSLCVCVAVVASADAAVTGVARTDRPGLNKVTGVALGDLGVVWGELPPFRRTATKTWTVRLASPGGPAGPVFSAELPQHAGRPLLDAARDQLAVVTRGFGNATEGWSLSAGPVRGPLTVLNESTVFGPDVRYSGTLLATREGPLVNVRDATAGYAARKVREDPNVAAVRIAGGRMATATVMEPSGGGERVDLRIDIISLDDGRTEYSVTLRDVSAVEDWSLQADGKVAWIATTTRDRSGARVSGILSWASPAEPRPHDLTTDAAVETLHLAGDRIVFTRRLGGWPGQPILQPWVTDLAGNMQPVWFPIAGPLLSDLEGGRLAVAGGGCIWLGDVLERLSEPPAGTCPQAVTGPGLRKVSRTGSRYGYSIHCVQAPSSGCRGEARLEAARSETGARRVIARRPFSAALGQIARVTFRNSRPRLRRLRNKKGRVWLYVRAVSKDPAGVTSESESFQFVVRP